MKMKTTCSLAFLALGLADHSWDPYRWEKTDPVLTISIGNCHKNVPSTKGIDWEGLFDDTVDKWNNIPEYQDGSGSVYSPNNVKFENVLCDTINDGIGLVQSFHGDYGDTGWLGIAQLWTWRRGGGPSRSAR